MSTLCPQCSKPMKREKEAWHCEDHGYMSAAYLSAVNTSTNLAAVMLSPKRIKIRTRNEEENRMIRILFQREHRYTQSRNVWIIYSPEKYLYLEVVRYALEAFKRQYQLDGSCPAVA